MAFSWADGWDGKNNNNGATQLQITTILATATTGTGDKGLLKALTDAADGVTIDKGIHDPGPHITVGYSGGTWHVDLVGTAVGGVAGYRVGKVTQNSNVAEVQDE